LREEHRLKIFENRVLRRIFGPKREDRSNIVRVIKSRRMRWRGHVACMGEWEWCLQGFGWVTRK
jgi:hypothetical protein